MNDEGSIKSLAFQSMTLPMSGHGAAGGEAAAGMRTPLRCLRLFVFGVLVPCVLIAIPLYQRQVTLAPRLFTLSVTDTRNVHQGISSVWCEAQELTSEAAFTAYRADRMLPQRSHRLPVTLHHRLSLSDDVKEYWGFYLLRGSRISVSACARWPGTSVLVVRGWQALNDCVWVGQLDSLEEESSQEEEDDDDDEALDPVRRRWKAFLMRERHGATPSGTGRSASGFGRSRKLTEGRELVDEDGGQAERVHQVPIHEGDYDAGDDKDGDGAHSGRGDEEDADGTDDTKHVSARRTLEELREARHVQRLTNRRKGAEAVQHTTGRRARPEHSDTPKPTARSMRERLTNDVIERDVSLMVGRGRSPSVAARPTSSAVDPIRRDGPATADRVISLAHNGHRGRVNQSRARPDTSNSEMMSSFSSSEEALLNCHGVILNQPLEASVSCALANDTAASRLTVQVIGDDYYYLVFSSENEVLPVDVHFDVVLEKTVYDTRAAHAVCVGSTLCRVALPFWSDEQVVVEYPVAAGGGDEAVWSEHYTVHSSCVSRGWLAAVFVVAALFSLFVCAFC